MHHGFLDEDQANVWSRFVDGSVRSAVKSGLTVWWSVIRCDLGLSMPGQLWMAVHPAWGILGKHMECLCWMGCLGIGMNSTSYGPSSTASWCQPDSPCTPESYIRICECVWVAPSTTSWQGHHSPVNLSLCLPFCLLPLPPSVSFCVLVCSFTGTRVHVCFLPLGVH